MSGRVRDRGTKAWTKAIRDFFAPLVMKKLHEAEECLGDVEVGTMRKVHEEP